MVRSSVVMSLNATVSDLDSTDLHANELCDVRIIIPFMVALALPKSYTHWRCLVLQPDTGWSHQ
jgi:hypothetical protein